MLKNIEVIDDSEKVFSHLVLNILKRPVPLEHYICVMDDSKAKNELFLILNKNDEFLLDSYKMAVDAKKRSPSQYSVLENSLFGHGHSIHTNLLEFLKNKDLFPAIVFNASHKQCDEAAAMLSADLTTFEEKLEIHKLFVDCAEPFTSSDHNLSQLFLMQDYCQRGFGVYHSGIVPMVREIVEFLFQKGYLKVVFVTEDSSMMSGNISVRTVVFDSVEKLHGNEYRSLSASEYIQIAGRAGRRGLDSVGTVIILSKDEKPLDLLNLANMLMGRPIDFESRLRVSYKIILNTLHMKHIHVEDVFQRLFVERNSLRLMSSRVEQLQPFLDQIRKLPAIQCSLCMPLLPSMAKVSPSLSPYGSTMAKPRIGTVAESTSIVDYFESLRTYNKKMQALWPELVLKYGVDKLFNQGRVLIVNYPPLNIYGRLAILLRGKRFDDGNFYMTVLIAANREFVATAKAKLKAFECFSMEEKKWFIESGMLTHCAIKGLEAIEPPVVSGANVFSSFDRHSYYVLEWIGLESLTAICKQSVKVYDSDTILREFHGFGSINRDNLPINFLRNMVTQLNYIAELWTNAPSPSSSMSSVDTGNMKPIYVIGKDIVSDEINIGQAIAEVRDLRMLIMDTKYSSFQACSAVKGNGRNSNFCNYILSYYFYCIYMYFEISKKSSIC